MDEKLQPADIIATASLAVAVLALFFTAWQAWIARRHSRLSVKPLLSWGTERNITPSTYEVISSLTNKGLGPAIVIERYFTVDEKRCAPGSSYPSQVEALVAELLPSDLKAHVARQSLPGEGSALLPAERMVIAHLVFPSSGAARSKEIEDRMNQVQFTVLYQDIYGQRYTFTT
jgi:hypothetical protein